MHEGAASKQGLYLFVLLHSSRACQIHQCTILTSNSFLGKKLIHEVIKPTCQSQYINAQCCAIRILLSNAACGIYLSMDMYYFIGTVQTAPLAIPVNCTNLSYIRLYPRRTRVAKIPRDANVAISSRIELYFAWATTADWNQRISIRAYNVLSLLLALNELGMHLPASPMTVKRSSRMTSNSRNCRSFSGKAAFHKEICVFKKIN